jgi:zinc protease
MKTPPRRAWSGLYGQAWRTSGTAKMDGDALDDLLEAKAAHIETAGDEDSTALSWDSLKGDSDQVFALALDLLLHPKFDQEKLELAQQQEATGIVRRNDDESAPSPSAREPSWSTAPTAPTPASPNWPPSAQSPSTT